MKKIWSRTLRPGEKWSGNIGRGKYIHFKALGDDANVFHVDVQHVRYFGAL